MKQTYRFHSNFGTVTKEFNGDKKAFQYAESMTDTAQMVRIEKKLDGAWWAWDVNGNIWVKIPITDIQVMVNGVLTTIKSNQKVVKNLLSKQDCIIDEDTPLCCDPSSETFHNM